MRGTGSRLGICGVLPFALGIAACEAPPAAAPAGAGAGVDVNGPAAPAVAVAPHARTPRLIAPLSGSRSDSRQPVFTWTRGANATLQICEDRACARIIDSVRGADGIAQPTTPLPAGVLYWRVSGRQELSATWEIVIPSRDAGLPTAFATLPDYDGDGFADVAIGDPAENAVFLFRGAFFPAFSSPDARLAGPSEFGRGVGAVGDVNGDGFVDLGVASGAEPGAVTIYLGGPSGPTPGPTLTASAATSAFGATLASAGDVDGDGYGDILVGGRPVAEVFLGGPAGPCTTAAFTLAPGASSADASVVQGPADVNADGHPDVDVGGAIYLGTGRSFALEPGSDFSIFASFAGDENGDGFVDFAAGAVDPGAPAGIDTAAFLLVEAGVSFLGAAGDVDGDGYGDTWAAISSLLGAPERERVYFGGPGSCGDTNCRRHSPIPIPGHDQRGGNLLAIIAAAGDVNGDGTDDVVVTTPDNGTAYLLLGSAGGLEPFPFRTWTGGAGFGASLPALFGSARPSF